MVSSLKPARRIRDPLTFLRLLRHLFTDRWAVKRAFSAAALRRIGETITDGERRHMGELEFAVEASLPFGVLLSGRSSKDRAIDWFGRLRVWDTAHNSGILIYVLLADRTVEIVADRGIHARVGDAGWQAIAADMQRAFADGRFEDGANAGLVAASELLARHFPATGENPNELPDEPVII